MPPDDANATSPDPSHARTPPKVPPCWEWTCWGVFVLGVFVVMGALTVLVFFADHERARWWGATLVACVLLPAFLFAAMNTFCAAKGFGGRKKYLMDEIGELIPEEVREGFYLEMHVNEVIVYADRDHQPEPYRQVNHQTHTNLPLTLTRYVDLLGAEVHAARAAAGHLAAALGGLFVAALQVYGKFAG